MRKPLYKPPLPSPPYKLPLRRGGAYRGVSLYMFIMTVDTPAA